MTRLNPRHGAFVSLFFLLIATISASKLGNFPNRLTPIPFEKSEPFPGNQSFDISSLGSDPQLQKRYCDSQLVPVAQRNIPPAVPTEPAYMLRPSSAARAAADVGKTRLAVTDARRLARNVAAPTAIIATRATNAVGTAASRTTPNAAKEADTVRPENITCCNDLACSELTGDYEDDYEDGGDESSSDNDDETDVDYSVYYMSITWTYYYYWYVYVYIVVEIDVTSTTVSLTSTTTTTNTRLTASATDSAAADAKFYDISASLESAAAETTIQDSIPTSGSMTTSETDVPDPTPTASVPSFPSPTSPDSSPTPTDPSSTSTDSSSSSAVSTSSSTVAISSSAAPDQSPSYTGPVIRPGTDGAAVMTPGLWIFAAAAVVSFVFMVML
ncbi:hypothetical protein PHISP_03324 [Aspergillus sp. HF37]|nr:hypothetical protein PHISP_03324 [Aspergillus sp. HF37]